MKDAYRLLIYCLLSVFLFACSQERRISKAIYTLDRNKVEAARYCESRFPIKDSVFNADTVFIEGNADYYNEEIGRLLKQVIHLKDASISDQLQAAESHKRCLDIVKNLSLTRDRLAKEAEELKSITPIADTVYIRQNIKVRDRRVEAILQAEIEELRVSIGKMKEAHYKARIASIRWRWLAIGTWILVLLFLAARYMIRRKM